jgi:hypothetical protein
MKVATTSSRSASRRAFVVPMSTAKSTADAEKVRPSSSRAGKKSRIGSSR